MTEVAKAKSECDFKLLCKHHKTHHKFMNIRKSVLTFILTHFTPILHLRNELNLATLLTLFKIEMGGEINPYKFFPCNFYKRWNKTPKTLWHLVLTLFLLWCKITELEPRTLLKKIGFSAQILITLRLW